MLRPPWMLTVQSLREWMTITGTGRCSTGRVCSACIADTSAEIGLNCPGLAQTKPTDDEVSA